MDRFACNYGAYCVTPMPGQPQVAITHAFFVKPEARGKGLGKQLKLNQLQRLRDLNYDYAQSTVRADNTAMKAILKECGLRYLDTFYSSAQGCFIELWGGALTRRQESAAAVASEFNEMLRELGIAS